MTDDYFPTADSAPNDGQPVLVLKGSIRKIIVIITVMVLFFVYSSLIALGQIETSRRDDEFTALVFAVLLFSAIVLFAVKARQMDLTKPTMVIGPDGISHQKVARLIFWSMIERFDIRRIGRAELIYLTVRNDADPEILEQLRKWQPLASRSLVIPPGEFPGYSSREVKDIVNRYYGRSQRC
ncbi:hypothetical protein EV128_103304 [Rhizobium azibense]|nr:hypothetical protein EV128_103304 [Rhizobium azibense]